LKIHTEHTHFKNGLSVPRKLAPHECPAKKIVYVSNDPTKLKALMIFQGRHTHPPWPEEKPTKKAKDDLQKCLDAYGVYGAMAGRVDNGEVLVTLGYYIMAYSTSMQPP
jgi:hypothetical protein